MELDNYIFSEESGSLEIGLENPFILIPDLTATDYSFNKNLVYIPSVKLSDFETLRIKAFIYTYIYLRELLNLELDIFLPNTDKKFTKFNLKNKQEIIDFKISNEYDIDNINLDPSSLVVTFEESSSDVYQAVLKGQSKIYYLPKVYRGSLFSEIEEKLFYKTFKENILSASLYLTKEIATIDLDAFIPKSNEQDNLLAFIKTLLALINNLKIDDEFNIKKSDINNTFYNEIYLNYLKAVYSIKDSILSGSVNIFLKEFENLLLNFQRIFNSPNFRQKIEQNLLDSTEIHLITSILCFLKLCDTKLC